jgi:hypothetical protein
MADLVALAQRRLALIRTARVTLAKTTTKGTVALSHPIGMRQCDARDALDRRVVAEVSQSNATAATNSSRNCRTVASPIECDNATTPISPLTGGQAPRQLIKRPPSWADLADRPVPGETCSCCGSSRWWSETSNSRGWRCWMCHPPDHLLLEVRDGDIPKLTQRANPTR